MPFEGSYLWRLRQKVGSDLVLMPGAMLFLLRADGAILFTRRADNGRWCFPSGGAEDGSSFGATAITELREETGVVVDPADLEGFACFSDPDHHTITYLNGDVTHCFAMLFLARRWTGEPRPDGVETTAMHWADPTAHRPRSARTRRRLSGYCALIGGMGAFRSSERGGSRRSRPSGHDLGRPARPSCVLGVSWRSCLV